MTSISPRRDVRERYRQTTRLLRKSGSLAAFIAIVVFGLVADRAVDAGELSFSLPIRCVPGETCWVANYVDIDPGPEARDFTCGFQTYDGHKGTDFAVRDLGVMRRGVDVLAAARGVVKGVRDGMDDVDFRGVDSKLLKGHECGNGVLLDHGNGWRTQYCHMRKGSVAVRPGQQIVGGQPLGKVGLSGETIFPHVHFQVTHAGKIIDPFAGAAPRSLCGSAAEPVWDEEAREQLPYRPFAIYNVGISGHVPDVKAIRDGKPPIGKTAAGWREVYLWVDIFGTESDDEVTFTLRDPKGHPEVEKKVRLAKRRARQFLYVGKRLGEPLDTLDGLTGTVTLKRNTSAGVVTGSAIVPSSVR
jgi:murein DD-endopeptidase MepM/ murein hydrolase activator NlpD